MTDQPEALRLANSLAAHSLSRHGQTQAARLLREQHAEIQELREFHQDVFDEKINILEDEIERLRGALKGIETLKVTVGGLPATAHQTEGWMRELAREALEVKT